MTTNLKSDLGIHYCHIPSCQNKVNPRLLMCRKHWNQVPRKFKEIVYANYRRGQETDKKPTEDYLRAARLAVDSVG